MPLSQSLLYLRVKKHGSEIEKGKKSKRMGEM